MYFTKEDFEKIKEYLEDSAKKDTDFPKAIFPLTGKETLAIVQNGCNVLVPLEEVNDYKDITEQFDALKEDYEQFKEDVEEELLDDTALRFIDQEKTDYVDPEDDSKSLYSNMDRLLDAGIYQKCRIGRPAGSVDKEYYTLETLKGYHIENSDGKEAAADALINLYMGWEFASASPVEWQEPNPWPTGNITPNIWLYPYLEMNDCFVNQSNDEYWSELWPIPAYNVSDVWCCFSDSYYKQHYSTYSLPQTFAKFKRDLPAGEYNIVINVWPSSTGRRDPGVSLPARLPDMEARVVGGGGGDFSPKSTGYTVEDFIRTEAGESSASYRASFRVVHTGGNLEILLENAEAGYNWYVFRLHLTAVDHQDTTTNYEIIPQVCMSQMSGSMYSRIIYSTDKTKYSKPYTFHGTWQKAVTLPELQSAYNSLDSKIALDVRNISVSENSQDNNKLYLVLTRVNGNEQLVALPYATYTVDSEDLFSAGSDGLLTAEDKYMYDRSVCDILIAQLSGGNLVLSFLNNKDDWSDSTIPTATTTADGAMAKEDKTTLDKISTKLETDLGFVYPYDTIPTPTNGNHTDINSIIGTTLGNSLVSTIGYNYFNPTGYFSFSFIDDTTRDIKKVSCFYSYTGTSNITIYSAGIVRLIKSGSTYSYDAHKVIIGNQAVQGPENIEFDGDTLFSDVGDNRYSYLIYVSHTNGNSTLGILSGGYNYVGEKILNPIMPNVSEIIRTDNIIDSAITKAKLNSNVADNVTIELDPTNGLQVANEGISRNKLSFDVATAIPVTIPLGWNSNDGYTCTASLNELNSNSLYIVFPEGHVPTYANRIDLYFVKSVDLLTLTATIQTATGVTISVDGSNVPVQDMDTRYTFPVTVSKVSVLQDGEVTKNKLADDIVEKTSLEIYNLPHNTIPNVESTSSLYEVMTAFSKLKLHVGNIDAVCVGSVFSSDNSQLVVFIKILTKDASGNWPYSTDYLQSDGSIIVPAVITIPLGSTAWELTYDCAGITMNGGDVIKSVYTETNTRTIIGTALTVNETALKNAYKATI